MNTLLILKTYVRTRNELGDINMGIFQAIILEG